MIALSSVSVGESSKILKIESNGVVPQVVSDRSSRLCAQVAEEPQVVFAVFGSGRGDPKFNAGRGRECSMTRTVPNPFGDRPV